MGNLFNALNGLQSNIFGGGNTGKTAPILRKHAIGMNAESPTSILDNDPFTFSSISYPRNQVGDYTNGHYMLFYVNVQENTKYTYTGSDGQPVGNMVEIQETKSSGGAPGRPDITRSKMIKNTGDKIEAKYAKGLVDRGVKGNNITGDQTFLTKQRARGGGMSSYHPTTKRITDSVALYLPPNVTDSTAADYEDAATGLLGFAAAGGGNFINAMKNDDFNAAAQSFIASAEGFASAAVLKAGSALAEGVLGAQGGEGLINKVFGQANNPFMEVLFKNMTLRQFTYDFKFAPKNTDERDDVQRIIQLFRFHMNPELKGANGRFVTIPSEFDIHYMYQHKDGKASENDYYNKIATCVLTACDVDYTPNGVRSFDDGSPTQIKMTLSFRETELLTKERVNLGY